MTVGIYIIRNRVTGNSYVGSSKNIENRFAQHETELVSGNHHSYKLQDDWTKLGKENFEFLIICKLIYDEDLLEVCERAYVIKHDSLKNGYNVNTDISRGDAKIKILLQDKFNSLKEQYSFVPMDVDKEDFYVYNKLKDRNTKIINYLFGALLLISLFSVGPEIIAFIPFIAMYYYAYSNGLSKKYFLPPNPEELISERNSHDKEQLIRIIHSELHSYIKSYLTQYNLKEEILGKVTTCYYKDIISPNIKKVFYRNGDAMKRRRL